MSSIISDKILSWYDKNARVLPWRISPALKKSGIQPDAYQVWLSEIMLQQTTVATVISYYEKFIRLWPTIFDLASATSDDIMHAWAGLGYYSRARNLHKTAQMIANHHQGIFPNDEKELIKFAGIGIYTSASIASIAFDQPAAVMDGNIERVVSRLYSVKTPLPLAKKELYQIVKTLTPQKRAGDYAQAMMDLGATVCTPKKPNCSICPLSNHCKAYAENTAELYPYKIKKPAKPIHHGQIIIITNTEHTHIVVEKRPISGLFGGMEIFPYINPHENKGKAFQDIDTILKEITDKSDIKHRTKLGMLKHIFTHFTFFAEVILVECDRLKNIPNDSKARIIPIKNIHTIAMPKLMMNALSLLKQHYQLSLYLEKVV